jgi:hypothetical protein
MKSRKGAISGNVPLLFLVVLSTGLGLQAYISAQTMADEVSQGMSDLGHVSNSKATNDVYYHQYIKNSGSFAVHQASYDVAQNGAGANWNGQTIEQITREAIVTELEIRTNDYFQDNYLQSSFEGTN